MQAKQVRKVFIDAAAVLQAAMLTALLAWSSSAQPQDYPQKAVRVVVPNAPGGPPDIISRILAQRLTDQLRQQFFVENRAGVGGALGAAFVAKSPADGYTLLYTGQSVLTATPLLFKDIGFDPIASFTPVAQVAITSYVLVVNAAIPVKTAAEFIAYAKARPGQLNYSSAPQGTPPHLVMEMFKSVAGVDITGVFYKGSAASLVDLIAGQTHVAMDGLVGIKPHITAGKLRPLLVTTEKRIRQLPDVPSAPEAGLPDFVVLSWQGVFAPRGTPEAIVNRLNGEIRKALQFREITEMFEREAIELPTATAQEFVAIIKSDVEKWAAVIKAAGIKAQ